MSHAVNSNVLSNLNPCTNKALHVLLMHGCETAYKIRGPSQNLTSSHIKCTVANVILCHHDNVLKRCQVKQASAPFWIQEKMNDLRCFFIPFF